MPAVSQRAKGWQSLRAPQRGVAEPEPVMLARHPDIAIKNRAVTRERGCASCERAGSWSVRVRWGRGCTECSAGVLRVGLWMSVDFFGRTCCRGPKIRLQLRSSLATSAKKVFGKQRLTSLVNVSFPAPNSKGESIAFPFFVFRSAADMVYFVWLCHFWWRNVKFRDSHLKNDAGAFFAVIISLLFCGSSSVGRAQPCQG